MVIFFFFVPFRISRCYKSGDPRKKKSRELSPIFPFAEGACNTRYSEQEKRTTSVGSLYNFQRNFPLEGRYPNILTFIFAFVEICLRGTLSIVLLSCRTKLTVNYIDGIFFFSRLALLHEITRVHITYNIISKVTHISLLT